MPSFSWMRGKAFSAYHMCQFMSNDGGSGFFIPIGGGLRIVEKPGFSVCHQTPILHGTIIKVRQGNLVCARNHENKIDFYRNASINKEHLSYNFFFIYIVTWKNDFEETKNVKIFQELPGKSSLQSLLTSQPHEMRLWTLQIRIGF